MTRSAGPFPQLLSPLREGLGDALSQLSYSQLGLVWDANLYNFWQPTLLPVIPRHRELVLPSGEAFKHLGSAQRLYHWLAEHQFDRHALVIGLGGGALTDLVGFCASTWKRGLGHAFVPSTLLAMVDAAYGGKTGLNFQGIKNAVGTFSPPLHIWIAPELLQTLSKRELRSGMAEMLKHALLEGEEHFNGLQQISGNEPPSWPQLERSLRVKQRIVEQDPEEKGIRKTLNLGHTLGHALESARLDTPEPLLHGEAIAIGLLLESHLAHRITGYPTEGVERLTARLSAWGFDLRLGAVSDKQPLAFLAQDKKNRDNTLRFVLLEEIGRPRPDIPVPELVVAETLRSYRALHG